MAINYQTEDDQYGYNCARFSDNGGCGYVLKPEFLRDPSISYSTHEPSGLDMTSFLTWKICIRIFGGFFIPRPKSGEYSNPYVLLRVRGHDSDKSDFETEHVTNNGMNPVWNEDFSFECKVPELAFLEFKVKHLDIGNCLLPKSKSPNDEELAEFCAPFTSILEGTYLLIFNNFIINQI